MLLGISKPDYLVLTPLLLYNVIMGIVGLVVGVMLWVNKPNAFKNAAIVVTIHFVVLIVLGIIKLMYSAVASHSINAMLIRTVVWTAIVTVSWKANRSVKTNFKKL